MSPMLTKDLVASTRVGTYPHHCDVAVTTAREMELKMYKLFTCLKMNESCFNNSQAVQKKSKLPKKLLNQPLKISELPKDFQVTF